MTGILYEQNLALQKVFSNCMCMCHFIVVFSYLLKSRVRVDRKGQEVEWLVVGCPLGVESGDINFFLNFQVKNAGFYAF